MACDKDRRARNDGARTQATLRFAAVVAQTWFVHRRGLVSGILTAGSATGQLVFLPLMAVIAERWGWRAASLLVAAAALAGVVPGGHAPADAQTSAGSSVIQVGTGRGRLITLARPMSDLFVADDSIADVQVRSPTQLYICGKKAGETTISATA